MDICVIWSSLALLPTLKLMDLALSSLSSLSLTLDSFKVEKLLTCNACSLGDSIGMLPSIEVIGLSPFSIVSRKEIYSILSPSFEVAWLPPCSTIAMKIA